MIRTTVQKCGGVRVHLGSPRESESASLAGGRTGGPLSATKSRVWAQHMPGPPGCFIPNQLGGRWCFVKSWSGFLESFPERIWRLGTGLEAGSTEDRGPRRYQRHPASMHPHSRFSQNHRSLVGVCQIAGQGFFRIFRLCRKTFRILADRQSRPRPKASTCGLFGKVWVCLKSS